MGYIGYVRHERVWFFFRFRQKQTMGLYPCLELSMCSRRSYFFFIIDKYKEFIKQAYGYDFCTLVLSELKLSKLAHQSLCFNTSAF